MGLFCLWERSRGPEACLAQGRSWLPEAATPKQAEPWTRLLLAFASSLFSVDAAVEAGGSKYQEGYRALLASLGKWLGVEFPPSASLLQGDSEGECEFQEAAGGFGIAWGHCVRLEKLAEPLEGICPDLPLPVTLHAPALLGIHLLSTLIFGSPCSAGRHRPTLPCSWHAYAPRLSAKPGSASPVMFCSGTGGSSSEVA